MNYSTIYSLSIVSGIFIIGVMEIVAMMTGQDGAFLLPASTAIGTLIGLLLPSPLNKNKGGK